MRFIREFNRLTPAQQALFLVAVQKFVADLRQGRFRAGLRVKAVQKLPGGWEMTWAPDGRAIFVYGEPKQPGDVHVIWRRIGGHDILDEP